MTEQNNISQVPTLEIEQPLSTEEKNLFEEDIVRLSANPSPDKQVAAKLSTADLSEKEKESIRLFKE